MSFAYRVGWPLWKLAARLHLPLVAKVTVIYDDEAKVFCATCDDFQPYLGIVTEGETPEVLNKKLNDCFCEGMYEAFKKHNVDPLVSARLNLVTE